MHCGLLRSCWHVIIWPNSPKAAAYHKKNVNVHIDQIRELQYMLFDLGIQAPQLCFLSICYRAEVKSVPA